MIHSYQEAFFRPNLTVILGFVQLSLFGEVDRAINFEFESLTEELTEGERAAASQQVTTGVANAFEVGVLDRPAALREIKARCDALGIPTTITDKMIEEAENEPPQPSPEELTAQAAMIKAERGGEGGGEGGGFPLQ
jgi:hypothetical protein